MSVMQQLLESVSRIAKHHEELKKARGETFNIFSVLRVENEEAAHSRFLKELLDPKGAHGMEDEFLRLFLQSLDLHWETKNAAVRLEVHLGAKTEISGGRVDIHVFTPDGTLLIENKILARDQQKQIERYLSGGVRVIYLTPEGREPECWGDISDKDKTRVNCISYKKDVLAWLKDCQKLATEHPILRETIRQYIILVQQLTDQNPDAMNAEIVNQVLEKVEYLEAYTCLLDAEWKVRCQIWNQLIAQLEKAIEMAGGLGGLKVSSGKSHHTDQHAGISFERPDLTASGLRIFFQFERKDCKDLGFGFMKNGDGTRFESYPNIRLKFSEKYGLSGEENDWWLAHVWWPAWTNWNRETYKRIYKGEFTKDVMKEVGEMLLIFENSKG